MRFTARLFFLSFVFGVSINVYAATYYVSAAGSDSAPGSQNAPFKTIEKGLSKLNSGDSLLLRNGDTWIVEDYLAIRTPGVTVGAYSGGNGSARPIIDGRKANRGGWKGKLEPKVDNVTIRDLELRNSGSIGLRFTSVNRGLVDNVKVDWTYRHGIQSFQSSNITIRNSEVAHHNNGWKYYGEPTWGNGISVPYSNDVLVERNIVREGFGEGIDSFYGSKRIVIQDNFLYANRAVGIYIDSTQDAVVRRNVVLGTTNSLYHRGEGSVGHGIALNNEKYQFSSVGKGFLPDSAILKNVRIYNNLVARTAAGIGIWGQHDATDYSDVLITHNTFIDNDFQLAIFQDKFSGSRNIIANNIFASLSPGVEDHKGANISSNLKFANNYWSQKPSRSFLSSSSDAVSGVKFVKMSGWRNISSISAVGAKDFMPLSGSPTLGKGTVVAWSEYSSDFNNQPINKSKIDLGAFQFGSSASKPLAAPAPPSSLVVESE
jgi:hypothetical protein